MPATTSLKALHDLIQASMPFEDYHLFEFRADGKRYAILDPEWDSMRDRTYSAKTTKLITLIDRGVTQIAYIYDFGDDWRFTVTLEAAAEADPGVEYPLFVEGEGRAPPEDVGGLTGFESFLEGISDPEHEAHDELFRWYGGPFNPNELPSGEIASRVTKLARRRSLGKAGFAESRGQVH